MVPYAWTRGIISLVPGKLKCATLGYTHAFPKVANSWRIQHMLGQIGEVTPYIALNRRRSGSGISLEEVYFESPQKPR